MTFSLEVLFQMFIVTIIIWIWEWMQREKEEVRTDDDDERKTKRNFSLRKTVARRRRCNEKKLFTKELKCLIFFMTKIQQTSHSDFIETEDGPTPDNRLVQDHHKDDPLAADSSYTETSADERPTLPHFTDVKAEKSDGATDKLIQDTLQEICDVIISVEADETRHVDGNNQSKTITYAQEHCPEALNNPAKVTASSQQTVANVDNSCKPQGSLLTDKEIATGLLYQPKGPRRLVKWENFDDDKNDDLKLDEGTGWDLNEMYATNAEKYNYKTTLDDDLSEYTTVLVREDTEEDRRRWERACRLADEIQKRCPIDRGERAAKLNNNKTNRNQYRQRRQDRYQNYSKQRN